MSKRKWWKSFQISLQPDNYSQWGKWSHSDVYHDVRCTLESLRKSSPRWWRFRQRWARISAFKEDENPIASLASVLPSPANKPWPPCHLVLLGFRPQFNLSHTVCSSCLHLMFWSVGDSWASSLSTCVPAGPQAQSSCAPHPWFLYDPDRPCTTLAIQAFGTLSPWLGDKRSTLTTTHYQPADGKCLLPEVKAFKEITWLSICFYVFIRCSVGSTCDYTPAHL